MAEAQDIDNFEGFLTVEDFGRGPWVGQTTLHPVGAIALLVLGCAVFLVPRRWVTLPLIVMACFIPQAQRIVVLTLNFDLLRIMVLCYWVRLIVRREHTGWRWKRLDTFVLAWAVVGAAAYCLNWGTWAALKYKLGMCFDTIGLYFLFRCYLRSSQDLREMLLGFAAVSVPVALVLLVEHTTRFNMFGVFGGVPLRTFVREGRLRCQGAFAHPILAGCFWAALLPLLSAGWWRGRAARGWAVVSACACGVTIFMCSSSTPLASACAGLVGVGLFPLRRHMRTVRWLVFAGLVGCHLMMAAPVWHLLSRVDIVGGSPGWWRYHLVDLAIEHLRDWWLVGTQTAAQWVPNAVFFDVCNQYVLEAITGGLVALVLFFGIIAVAFDGVGRLCRAVAAEPAEARLAWALGVALFVHSMNMLGVAYSGQIVMVWYALLAAIAGLTPLATAPVAAVAQTGWRSGACASAPQAIVYRSFR